MTRTVKAVAILTLLAATEARADRRQEHQRFEFAPAAETWLAPSGQLCDFDYEQQDLGGWLVRNRFYDADGNRIGAVLIGEVIIRHTNLDTGESFVETYHHSTHRDFLTGEETVAGNFWHLRDDTGKIVLVGAGQMTWDVSTGELVHVTPNSFPDFPATVCPALGGAPASP